MSNTDKIRQMIQKANELESNANMLDAALLAPSMKSDALRAEAQGLRDGASREARKRLSQSETTLAERAQRTAEGKTCRCPVDSDALGFQHTWGWKRSECPVHGHADSGTSAKG